MVLMFIINLTNVTSVSNAISPLGDISVINIAEGLIPEATYKINSELNPRNLTELLEFTTRYMNPTITTTIPSDETFTTNVNIYKDQFIEITKKSMPFFTKVFTSDTAFNELFVKEIKRKTDDINSLSFNVSEYKAHRERVNITPLTKEESERQLLQQQNTHDKHSAALAFKYAQESEKVKQKQQSFWGDIKQLSGW